MQTLLLLAFVATSMSLFGCHSSSAVRITPRADAAPIDASTIADRDPRTLMIFDGHTGQPVAWDEMIDRLLAAHVVILGEQHDDAVAHAAQVAIVQDVAARQGASRRVGALALEMLERDEQAVTDDYLEGLIDAQTLATLTHSASWAGEGSWAAWYQPAIDAARDAGWHVVAANAPRRYVRLARTQGYDTLRALPASRRALISLPRTWPTDYRQRFADVMAGMSRSDDEDEDQDEGDDGDATPAATPAPAHGPLSPERIDASFRSQLLWDSTMADSIARSVRSGARPVIHLVGQFHSDFNGGTVQELRARLGRNARIITVSMQRRDADTLRPADRGRADFVIHTGRRPPRAPEPAEDQPN